MGNQKLFVDFGLYKGLALLIVLHYSKVTGTCPGSQQECALDHPVAMGRVSDGLQSPSWDSSRAQQEGSESMRHPGLTGSPAASPPWEGSFESRAEPGCQVNGSKSDDTIGKARTQQRERTL